jgi:hypothetical protein
MKTNPSSHERRRFLQTAAAGAVLGPYALTLSNRAIAAEPNQGASAAGFPNFAKGEVLRTSGAVKAGDRFAESARDIPIAGRSDVLVVGGGPAGIGAALAAARAGAKTQLIETAGCLGGVWTAGMLTKIIDGNNKAGIMKEILAAMAARGSSVAKETKGAIYDPELMKLVLEEMCVGAGVKIRLHTQLVGAVTDRRNRLVAVITESKSGRQAWTADRFVDCSGDGDLAAQAGCRFEIGATADCECQPMSLMALLAGVNTELIPEFIREIGGEQAKTRFHDLMKQAGINPSYRQPTLRHLHSGIFSIMTNHEYGVPAYDAGQVTEATLRARAEIHAIVAGLRKIGGPWKDVEVVATAEQIGVREGRRVRGRAKITADDLAKGKKSDAAVCRVTFGIDVHDVWSNTSHPNAAAVVDEVKRRRAEGVKPYDIPLAALIAADVDGLMMAGRCISGDFIAHASYRVTGNAVPMGEAAGLTSAMSLRKGRMPHEVTWNEVKGA